MISSKQEFAVPTMAIVVAMAFVATIHEAEARGFGGGFSHGGVAASGSFSSGGRAAASASRLQGGGTAAAAPRPPRQDSASANQQTRQEASGADQAARQSAATSNQAQRQQEATTRQEDYYHPPPPPGAYYSDDDWDNADAAEGLVAGAAVAAVAASASRPVSESISTAAPPVPVATLPCSAQVTNVDGITYYRCGQTDYVQAYSGSGPIYMPVQPPQ